MFEKYDPKCFRKKRRYSFINCTKSDFLSSSDTKVNNYIRDISQKYKNVFVVDLRNLICLNNKCSSVFRNFPLYDDTNHLSLGGSKKLGEFAVNHNKIPSIFTSKKFLNVAKLPKKY